MPTAPLVRLSLLLGLIGLLAGACTGDDPAQPAPDTTRTTLAPEWEITQADGSIDLRAGDTVVAVELASGALVGTRDGELFFEAPSPPSLLRDDTRVESVGVRGHRFEDDAVLLDLELSDDTSAVLSVRAVGPGTVAVELRPDRPEGITGWEQRFVLEPDELVYGLTERIVDDLFASEIVPEEVGSLDRRGEAVTMEITPTMSGYAPFHQTSRGVGVLVDGYLPGTYDVAATEPDQMALTFEWGPLADAASYHVFTGPDHPAILRAYFALTGEPPVPPPVVFAHWRGRDELEMGDPVEVEGILMNSSVASDLLAYEEFDIPAGVYHFDRPWAAGEHGFGELRFDPERFPNTIEMLETLVDRGWSNMVWVAPWAIGPRGEVAEASGWLAPGSPRDLDLTDPDAVAWLREDVLSFLDSDEGRFVDGFFMDRGDELHASSGAEDLWADGRSGRAVVNWYPVAYARLFREIIDEARPGTGYLLARPGYTGSQAYVTRWGGDTRSREGLAIPEQTIDDAPSTDLGLRSVLISLQRAAFMGTPYWGSDIGGYTAWIDRDLYARWIQVGFASPIMRFHGQGGTPWEPTGGGSLDEELLEIYQRYVKLRHAMIDLLVETADRIDATGMPIARPLVFEWPDEPGATNRWDQWMLGDDLLVAPVWRSGEREREVWIPPGEWVDFWDRDSMVEGPTEISVDAPLDVLPMWVRPGSPVLDLEVP